MEEQYYLQNKGFVGNALIWWAKDSRGYTTDIREAHRFSKEEAIKQAKMREEDVAWSCDYIDGIHVGKKLIVDSQYIDYDKAEKF